MGSAASHFKKAVAEATELLQQPPLSSLDTEIAAELITKARAKKLFALCTQGPCVKLAGSVDALVTARKIAIEVTTRDGDGGEVADEVQADLKCAFDGYGPCKLAANNIGAMLNLWRTPKPGETRQAMVTAVLEKLKGTAEPIHDDLMKLLRQAGQGRANVFAPVTV